MKIVSRRFVPIILCLLVAGSAWAQTRVATVDLRKLFDGYWKTKQAQAALKTRSDELLKEIDDLKTKLRRADEEYRKLLTDASDQAVSAEERDRRKKAADAKLKEMNETRDNLMQFQTVADTNIKQQTQRMRQDIIVEINKVVAAKAKSAGYHMVLDTAAETVSGTSIVLYTGGDNDITDDVLKQLNVAAPINLSKPADKK